MENNVTLFARKKDDGIVKQAAEAAAKSYHEISGREVNFEVEASLADEGCVFIPLTALCMLT